MEEAPRRLKRRREFLQVARAGRKFAAPGLVLQALKRREATKSDATERMDDDEIRVGFTVTRKIGDAVVRNRARRRLRAAADTVMAMHAARGHDYVVIGRAQTVRRPFAALVGDLETALRELGAWRVMAVDAVCEERDDR